MLYYDGTESRKGTRLPNNVIEYGESFPDLEKVTGADLLVFAQYTLSDKIRRSKKPLPLLAKELGITIPEIVKEKKKQPEDILLEYTISGAVLVQRKSGMDLIDSIGNRLNGCLAKMKLITHCQAQRVLLYTGSFTEGANGQLFYNGKQTNYQYWSFKGAESAFVDRGGVSIHLTKDADILQWIKVKEQKLQEYLRADTKYVYSDVYFPADFGSDDVLQLPVKVTDGRLVLNHFPGLGPTRINALYEYIMSILGYPPSTFDLLRYATSFETAKNVEGWGKKIIENNREFLGLEKGYLAISDNNLTVQKE